MDSDLNKRLGISLRDLMGRGPDASEAAAAVAVVRTLLGPGRPLSVDGTRFEVHPVIGGGGTQNILFWVRDSTMAHVAGLEADWCPAEWPYGISRLVVPGVRTVPSVVLKVWKFRGHSLAADEGSALYRDEARVGDAAVRVHASARKIVNYLINEEVEQFRTYQAALATSGSAETRAAASRLEVTAPTIAATAPFSQMLRILDQWRATQEATVERVLTEEASRIAPRIREALSNRATAAHARDLGYTTVAWRVEYLPGPGVRPKRSYLRDIGLLTHNGNRVEQPPVELDGGLHRTGDWSVAAADSIALCTDAPRILGAPPPRGPNRDGAGL